MKKYGIKQQELPNSKVINKENILKLLSDNKDSQELKMNQVNVEKVIINIVDNKNYLPQIYFENTTNFNSLTKYIENMNKDHKLNLDIADFIAKV
jgi:hypothetical protein